MPGGRRDTGRRGRRSGHAASAGYRAGYFTEYQFSGVMLSVGLCGSTPFSLLFTSVSAYAPLGWNMTGSCSAR